MKDGKTKIEYLPELLTALRLSTGWVFMAVCAAGATLASPGGWSTSFEELLDCVPAGIRVIIPVVCGNDILANWKVPSFQEAWSAAARRLCQSVQVKSSR